MFWKTVVLITAALAFGLQKPASADEKFKIAPMLNGTYLHLELPFELGFNTADSPDKPGGIQPVIGLSAKGSFNRISLGYSLGYPVIRGDLEDDLDLGGNESIYARIEKVDLIHTFRLGYQLNQPEESTARNGTEIGLSAAHYGLTVEQGSKIFGRRQPDRSFKGSGWGLGGYLSIGYFSLEAGRASVDFPSGEPGHLTWASLSVQVPIN